MSAPFHFKQFSIQQGKCAMKVTEIACLFAALVNPSMASNILDIGAGTGVLSLMIAQKTSASVVAIEVNQDTFVTLKKNVDDSPFASRIETIYGDICSYFPSQTFDLILTNPPFFENQLKAKELAKNMAWHDASLRKADLLEACHRLLQSEGVCWLLFPYLQDHDNRRIFSSFSFYISEVIYIRHSERHPISHCVYCISKNSNRDYKERSLCIRDYENRYTPEVYDLFQPYYLHL